MMIMAMTKATELPMPTVMLNPSVARHPNGTPTALSQVAVHLADVVAPSTEVVASQDPLQPMATGDTVHQDLPGLSMALLQAEDVLRHSLNRTPILPVSPPSLFSLSFLRSWQRRLTTVK